ncbi:class I SAM-dependent methyltransferase [uncultured Roseobacter sp.]|uniref:class I SAM-dependent methyltransferase n=1 Tax=uncultured Roseobacter sp. TaxID=114847 RepID=UPI002605CDB4|nr:class I SAM-dependent methyltransferase [uncultured Roseobacter sp.]
MIDTRVALALEAGSAVLPPDGLIAVFRPPAQARLDRLPKDRTEIIVDARPDYDLWQARGFRCTVDPQESYAGAIVIIPRAKAEARALIAKASALTGGALVIDGQKTDGVDSLLREMRKRVVVEGPISKAHGKLFWINRSDDVSFEDWVAGPALTPGGFWTAPGVFSADGIDPASALLVETLPDDLGPCVADLGAGWGFLSAHILTRPEVREVHLVEAGHMALACAQHNVTDARAHFHWADATTWQPAEALDTIVMNPPFHAGRKADPSLGQGFVEAAARLLKPQGQLFMVANRHLPYEATLHRLFTNCAEIDGDSRFKVFHASRPRRTHR